MENENEKNIVVAYVTMKTSSGLSIHKDIRKLSLNTIDAFRPIPDHVDQVVKILTHAGFKIVARTAAGVSFSGPIQLFKSEFKGCTFEQKEMWLKDPERPDQKKKRTEKPARKVVFYVSTPKLMINKKLENLAESVHLTSPAKHFHDANHPSSPLLIISLTCSRISPKLLNVSSLHAADITGKGVRVSMVDTGFVTRVTEEMNPL